MNYRKIYNALIAKAQASVRNKNESYFELHHIVPRCMGGSDKKDNLVLLTAREHYIAHMLLWRIDRTNYKLFAPLLYFKQHKHVKNSKTFEEIRIIHGKFMSDYNPSLFLSDEAKASKSLKLKNRIFTEEHKLNISKANTGKQSRLNAVLSETSKKSISDSLKEHFINNPISNETREKLRVASTGRHHTEESLEIMISSAKNRVRYICPHCSEQYDGGNLINHMVTKLKYEKEYVIRNRENWIKPEGWVGPSHAGNHGLLAKAFE